MVNSTELLLSDLHPSKYFESSESFEKWVADCDAKHLYGFMCPDSKISQCFINIESNKQLLGTMGYSSVVAQTDDYGSCNFHINFIAVDKAYRGKQLTPYFIDEALSRFIDEREQLFQDGCITVTSELICTPTQDCADSFCARFESSFNSALLEE